MLKTLGLGQIGSRRGLRFGLLAAVVGSVFWIRSGGLDPRLPIGLTSQPCPPAYSSNGEIVFAVITGDADRRNQRDWANLCAFRAENQTLKAKPPPLAVLIGDSITAEWLAGDPQLFGQQFVNRGIGGQTSAQVLLRFTQDAANLRPRIIHVMAGANDIGGYQGPSSVEDIHNSIRAMADIAQANGAVLILGSITPIHQSKMQPRVETIGQIVALNGWLRALAAQRGGVYADYHAVLAEPSGALKAAYSIDGVHLNAAGYAAMRPMFDAAIKQAEAKAGE